MNSVKFDVSTMQTMMLFEKVTHVACKDCILNEGYLFIVPDALMGKAIGKQGVNIKKLESLLKKKVKVVGFVDDISIFVMHLIAPLRASPSFESGVLTLTGKDHQSRGLLIGRDKKHLDFITSVVKRYFDVEEVKVV